VSVNGKPGSADLEMTWYTVGLSGLSMRAMRDMGYLGVE
jgi:hypothetical protein